MILCGSGNTIKAYKSEGPHAPVADFRANTYHIVNLDSVSFYDQTSFSPTTWYWEFPGGDPPVSTDPSPANITYPQAGTYDVTLIASNEFGSDTVTKPCYIEVDYVVNVEAKPQQAYKVVFPNPADDFVFVSTENESGTWVTNSLGEIVFRDMDLKKERKIDCSKFNPGIYIITILNDGSARSEKLIVNH
jgi:PKD repeat protein